MNIYLIDFREQKMLRAGSRKTLCREHLLRDSRMRTLYYLDLRDFSEHSRPKKGYSRFSTGSCVNVLRFFAKNFTQNTLLRDLYPF